MRGQAVGVNTDDDGDDDVAGCHQESPGGEDGFTTDLVDPDHGRDGGKEHPIAASRQRQVNKRKKHARNTHHTRGQQAVRVPDEAEILEDGRCIVEDRVDTRPLLEEHDAASEDDAVEEGAIGKEREVSENAEFELGGEAAVLVVREAFV